MKLTDTLLLSAAIGSFLLWLLEISRGAQFADTYWLLLAALSFLLGFQLARVRRRQKNQDVSPTIRQMAQDRQKRANQPKQAKKK